MARAPSRPPFLRSFCWMRVQMPQGPRLDARSLEVAVEIVLPEPEHATHLVCGDVALVDEAVQLAQADTEVRAGGRSPHPLARFDHAHTVSR